MPHFSPTAHKKNSISKNEFNHYFMLALFPTRSGVAVSMKFSNEWCKWKLSPLFIPGGLIPILQENLWQGIVPRDMLTQDNVIYAQYLSYWQTLDRCHCLSKSQSKTKQNILIRWGYLYILSREIPCTTLYQSLSWRQKSKDWESPLLHRHLRKTCVI